ADADEHHDGHQNEGDRRLDEATQHVPAHRPPLRLPPRCRRHTVLSANQWWPRASRSRPPPAMGSGREARRLESEETVTEHLDPPDGADHAGEVLLPVEVDDR